MPNLAEIYCILQYRSRHIVHTVAADDIGNNHLGTYKQPNSPRRSLWLQELCVHAKQVE